MQKTQTKQFSLTSPHLNPEDSATRRHMGRAVGLLNLYRPGELLADNSPAPRRIRVHVTPGDVGDILLHRIAARAGFDAPEDVSDEPALVIDFLAGVILSDSGKAWPKNNPTTVSLDRALTLLSHYEGQTTASGVQK